MPIHYYLTIIFILIGFYLLFSLKPNKTVAFKRPKDLLISIIIPARNESKRIQPLLESLLPYKNDLEIIVVDDHSDDDTKSVVMSFGFQVIQPNKRPKAWKGKPWALDQGVLSAFFNVLVVMAANAYTIFKHKLTPRAFFGPTQVMLKKDYLDFARDPSVTNQVLEDIYLGQSFLKHGKNIRSIIGKNIVSFRMYPDGYHDMLSGFGKNFANGAIAIGMIQAILLSLWISAPYAAINILLTALISGEAFLMPILIYVVFGLQLYFFSRHIGNFKPTLILMYPLHALFFLYVFIYSFFRIYIFKNNVWKGRSV